MCARPGGRPAPVLSQNPFGTRYKRPPRVEGHVTDKSILWPRGLGDQRAHGSPRGVSTAFGFSTASVRHPAEATRDGAAATLEAPLPGTGHRSVVLLLIYNMRRTRSPGGLPPSRSFHLIQEKHSLETCQHVIGAASSPDWAVLSPDGSFVPRRSLFVPRWSSSVPRWGRPSVGPSTLVGPPLPSDRSGALLALCHQGVCTTWGTAKACVWSLSPCQGLVRPPAPATCLELVRVQSGEAGGRRL